MHGLNHACPERAWRQGVGREKEGEVAGRIERSNPTCSGSQNLFTEVLASEGWGQMRMIPLQAYPAQQWLFPIHKHCTSYNASSDWIVNLSDPRIACKMRALDFEIFHYMCMRARFMNGIPDIVHQN